MKNWCFSLRRFEGENLIGKLQHLKGLQNDCLQNSIKFMKHKEILHIPKHAIVFMFKMYDRPPKEMWNYLLKYLFLLITVLTKNNLGTSYGFDEKLHLVFGGMAHHMWVRYCSSFCRQNNHKLPSHLFTRRWFKF